MIYGPAADRSNLRRRNEIRPQGVALIGRHLVERKAYDAKRSDRQREIHIFTRTMPIRSSGCSTRSSQAVASALIDTSAR